jgi:hypothetical protein
MDLSSTARAGGRQQPARRPGIVGVVAALVAVMLGVREYLDDSARAVGEVVAQQDERCGFESAVNADL